MRTTVFFIFLLNLVLGMNSYAQNRAIRGTVTDEEGGQPLPGVNVILKGTQQGTLTDIDGAFSLQIPDSVQQPVLIASFVGYADREIPVTNSDDITISLATQTQELDEVVVVGYGTINRSKLASSISSVSGEDIEADPVASLNQAVQGKIAGVQVTQNSGTPGGALNFRIRGINTLNSSTTEPLYVVDGVPLNTDNFQGISRGGRQSLNIMASLSPSDISSIEVLKDASATAIYGARAANGVVLITTKRGKNGQNQITFNTYYGVQKLANKIELANADQYIQYIRDSYNFNEVEPDPAIFDKLADTDWQDQIYRTAPMQSYALSASGGSENTSYYISGNYFNQDGIVINSGFERINFRTNIEHELNNRVKFGANVNLSRATYDKVLEDFANGAPVTTSLVERPNIPIYYENGDFYLDPIATRENPVATATLASNQDITDRIIGNVYAEVGIIKGLTFRSNWGLDKSDTEGNFTLPNEGTLMGQRQNGLMNYMRYKTFNWLNENTLNYDIILADDHDLTVLVGNTLQKADIYRLSVSGTDFPSNDLYRIAMAQNYNASDYLEGWALASFFSRVNYVFNDRYILTANYRIDGSSRFGVNNQYGYFPSLAAAWRISEEEFIRNIPAINNLKIRASWGKSGNQPRDFYNALAYYGVNAYYGGQSGYAPSVIGNPDLAWETTTQTDIGLDIGLFDDRISLIADYYVKNTDDLLTSLRLPEATGTLFTLVNLGTVRNTGFEFELNTANLIGDFRWNTSFNMSFYKNTVTSLPGGDIPDGIDDASHYAREGEPLGSFYGYVAEGIDPETGNIIYADLDNDGERSVPGSLDPDDREIIGNPHPDFYGGITNNLYYMGFDLGIQGQFVYGNDIWNFTRRTYESLSGPGTNLSVEAMNYWTPSNQNADYPRPSIGATTNNLLSTRWIEDGSFFRIRDVTLGYSLPAGSLGKSISSLRVYVQAQNLYNFTNYKGYDPEINVYENRGSMIGADFGSYPRARTFLVGLNVTF